MGYIDRERENEGEKDPFTGERAKDICPQG